MFSKLKHVKFRCFLGVKSLENILRIIQEGSSWENFDSMSAMKKWSIDKVRHTTLEKGPHSYQSHNSAKVKTLSVMMTVTVKKKIF